MSDKALDLVYNAVDEINAMGEDDIAISKSRATSLFADDGGVDSLTFVNLIVAIEQRIMDETGEPVILVTEETMTLESNPFQNIGTLADHVAGLLS